MIDLTGKNVTYYGYTSVIDTASVTRLCQALNIASNNNADFIYLCLNSFGGAVADGIYLYNHIRALPVKMILHATGLIASIAAIAFVAAEVRYATDNSLFLIHATTVGPYPVAINGQELKSAVAYADAEDDRTDQIFRARTTITDEILLSKRSREIYLSPQEALKFGLVHEIGDFSVPAGVQVIQI
jgi:ATP-dependent Clp protease protease subunit